MSEWKKLEIDNLPPDILTGDYEFMTVEGGMEKSLPDPPLRWRSSKIGDLGIEILQDIFYRKPESLPPTHKEIMSKWWYDDEYKIWVKVIAYRKTCEPFKYRVYDEEQSRTKFEWVSKPWFTGRESATIPPEA